MDCESKICCSVLVLEPDLIHGWKTTIITHQQLAPVNIKKTAVGVSEVARTSDREQLDVAFTSLTLEKAPV